MAERTNIPATAECGRWETLLADALDGALRPEDEATFASHMAACPACTELFEEARKGREWLGFLAAPEVPAGLLDKILAQTGPSHPQHGVAAGAGVIAQMPQPWQQPGFVGQVRRFAQPRLMMTAAMAFFSIALTLNLTGINVFSLRGSDLRPSVMRSFMERRITMASTPIVRYYDHLRYMYEVQSRVDDLRQMGGGEGNDSDQKSKQPTGPGESKQAPGNKNGGSRVNPPQETMAPAIAECLQSAVTVEPGNTSNFLKSSLTFENRSADSGGSATTVRNRSTLWTA